MEESNKEKIRNLFKKEYKIVNIVSICFFVLFFVFFFSPCINARAVLPLVDSAGNSTGGTISIDHWNSPFIWISGAKEFLTFIILIILSFSSLLVCPIYSFFQRKVLVTKKSPVLLFGKIMIPVNIGMLIICLILTMASLPMY